MSDKSVAVLREAYERAYAESDERFAASNGLWTCPEFSAVREAMDVAETDAEHDYYMAWFMRLVEEWNPLHEATVRAQRICREAFCALHTAEQTSKAATAA